MHSWIFRHRARLAVIYGLAPSSPQATPKVQPGGILTTPEGVLLGPWGRRVG